MNHQLNNELLFNYIEKSQNNPLIITRFFFAGFVFSLIFIVIYLSIPSRELTLAYVTKVSLASIVGGVFWAGISYWIYMRFEKSLMKENSKAFVKPLPDYIGTVLTKITCNVTLNSVALDGMLFVGSTGFSFIPNKYNWFKSVHKWGDKSNGFDSLWDEVNAIYKSTGSYKIRDIFNAKLADRLAIEVDDQSYFFVINAHLDNVIEDLNSLLDSH